MSIFTLVNINNLQSIIASNFLQLQDRNRLQNLMKLYERFYFFNLLTDNYFI